MRGDKGCVILPQTSEFHTHPAPYKEGKSYSLRYKWIVQNFLSPSAKPNYQLTIEKGFTFFYYRISAFSYLQGEFRPWPSPVTGVV